MGARASSVAGWQLFAAQPAPANHSHNGVLSIPLHWRIGLGKGGEIVLSGVRIPR